MIKLNCSVLFFFHFLIVNFSFSHLEIFQLSDGEFINGTQNLKTNYGFTLKFKEKTFIDQIGIDFFDVGEDGKAKIQLKIYDENKLIFDKNVDIKDVYSQIAYIDVNSLFFINKNYVFNLILVNNSETNHDNLLRVFKPNQIPLDIKENPFITNEINSSIDSIYPFNKSIVCPFIHIGTTNQKGIDFSILVDKQEFEEKNKSINRSTIFSVENSDLFINKIGLNYFETGLNNESNLILKLIDLTNNTFVLIDTIIYNHHKKPLNFIKSTRLIKNHIYSISLILNNENNLDDLMVLFKPKAIPYIDNLNKIKIIEFQKNNTIDSLGLPFTFEFDEDKFKLGSEIKNLTKNKIIINNQVFYYDESKNIKTIKLYDFTGRELNNVSLSDENFEKSIIIENNIEINLLQIIFEDFSSSNYILSKQGNQTSN